MYIVFIQNGNYLFNTAMQDKRCTSPNIKPHHEDFDKVFLPPQDDYW